MMLINSLNQIVWGKTMLLLLLATGVYLLIRLRFQPFIHPGLLLKKTIGSLFKKRDTSGVTPFQAVSTALAGTLGVGSVVGVTTALTMGGAGALFWMWVSAFIGMVIKYVEVVLALHFRVRNADGSFTGGPMTTLEYGCHMPFLGILFAVLCIFASFGIGNLTPANTIAETMREYLPLPSVWIGIGIMAVIAWIILGKNDRIMRINEIMIPIVSILYLAACIYLLFLHGDRLLPSISSVFSSAFTLSSFLSGTGGYMISRALHYGITRGIFSNEAGMGSAPIAHAGVVGIHPVEQGFWGIFEVFFDTIVVCTITGLVVLTSGLLDSGLSGAALDIACFSDGFGELGGIVFAISIVSFAIPSIIGWYYYAKECIQYLWQGTYMLKIYQFVFLLCLVQGACMELPAVWEIADALNGCMAVPNLISLLFLAKVVVKLTKEYMIRERK